MGSSLKNELCFFMSCFLFCVFFFLSRLSLGGTGAAGVPHVHEAGSSGPLCIPEGVG